MTKFNFHLSALRLGEFDLGGVLYHANYFHVYEMAREALLVAGGLPYPKLVEQGFHLAIVESHLEFEKPIRYGQPLEIQVHMTELKQSSVVFNYEIFSGGERLHSGWTKNVFVETSDKGFTPRRMPEELRKIFERHS